MATEYESKVRELLSTLGTSQAPWAKALLKTVQSKNISLSEWNTVLEKLAEASNDGDTLANAFLALPLEVLEQLEIVQGTGESETAVMSQKATTETVLAVTNTVNNFNADLAELDRRVEELETSGGGGASVEVVHTTGKSTSAVMSQKASTESFVPRITTTSTNYRAYIVTGDGKQGGVIISSNTPDPNSLAMRKPDGTIRVGTPALEKDAVPLGYANEHYVPIPDADFDPTNHIPMWTYDRKVVWTPARSGNETANSVVMRDGGAQSKFGPPTHEDHVVPLGYADGRYVIIKNNTGGEYPQAYVASVKGGVTVMNIRYAYAQADLDTASYSIVQRDNDRRIQSEWPVKKIDVATKGYVDAVYRHDILFRGAIDFVGTIGCITCSVYSRSKTPWYYDGDYCTIQGVASASGFIKLNGKTYPVVGLEKGDESVSYFIHYADPDTGTVSRFSFYDYGEGGNFTDTVTQMN